MRRKREVVTMGQRYQFEKTNQTNWFFQVAVAAAVAQGWSQSSMGY